MIKNFEQFVNEDFTKLYGRWNSGKKRKEDGSEIKTPYGTMILKNRNCDYEGLIKMFLNEDEGDICASYYMIQNVGYSADEIHNIINCKAPYDYPLEDLKHGGLCISFLPYNESIESYIETDEYCEDDYISICKCLAQYMKDNVDISNVKGKPGEYKLLLYSGDLPDDFDWDMFKEEFENYFNTDIDTWSFSYETNIGVEINYKNVNKFKEMKDEINGWMKD